MTASRWPVLDQHTPARRILYIGGYGRSGSTLLDILLSQTDASLGCGEIATLNDVWQQRQPCACGQKISHCPQWHPCLPHLPLHWQQLEHRHGLFDRPQHLLHRLQNQPEALRQYATEQAALFQALEPTHSRVLIDSSKNARHTAWRPLLLAACGHQVYFLHLQRALLPTLASVLRVLNHHPNAGLAKRLHYSLRALPGWWLAHQNSQACMQQLPAKRSLSMHWADFCREPARRWHQLQDWLPFPLSEASLSALLHDGIAPGHQIGGNRLRRQKHIRLHH